MKMLWKPRQSCQSHKLSDVSILFLLVDGLIRLRIGDQTVLAMAQALANEVFYFPCVVRSSRRLDMNSFIFRMNAENDKLGFNFAFSCCQSACERFVDFL